MTNEALIRFITSLLVIGSLPPLFLLLKELLSPHRPSKSDNAVQYVLLIIYLTFLVSGLISLYINVQFQFFGAKPADYTMIALFRNVIKQIGIVFVSWKLYFITKGR